MVLSFVGTNTSNESQYGSTRESWQTNTLSSLSSPVVQENAEVNEDDELLQGRERTFGTIVNPTELWKAQSNLQLAGAVGLPGGMTSCPLSSVGFANRAQKMTHPTEPETAFEETGVESGTCRKGSAKKVVERVIGGFKRKVRLYYYYYLRSN